MVENRRSLFADSIDVMGDMGNVLGQDWMRRIKYGGKLPEEESANEEDVNRSKGETKRTRQFSVESLMNKPGSEENLRAISIHSGPDHATKKRNQRIQQLGRKQKIGNRAGV